jgi:hypothetical protein
VRLSSVAEGGLLGSDIRGLLGCWRSDSRRAALAFGWTCQPRRCAPRTLPATRPVPWRACFPAVRDRRAAQRPDPARPGPVTRSVPGSEAPPVARMATGLVGEEPVPSRVWTPAFAQMSRSVNRAGRVGSHGFTHATQPFRFEVADAANLRNVATKRDEIATPLGPVLPVPTTVRRKASSIRSTEPRAVASPDSSTLHQQWDFQGKQ